MDRAFALLLIFITLPVMAILSLTILLDGERGIIFKQARNGLNQKIFTLYKFRTMNCKRSPSGDLLPDKDRLTNIGKIIRKTSLDELPQLLNILKGDMSFVGPRPLLLKYLPYFRTDEKKRFLVRPGISGLAQVSGRNILNWDRRLAYDVEYVYRISLWLDIKIIFMTVYNVFASKDIIIDPESIMKNLDDERRTDI
jgi:lipopolysaccharide/colanic/teichoic acid biosynthesis glycosyltransferase